MHRLFHIAPLVATALVAAALTGCGSGSGSGDFDLSGAIAEAAETTAKIDGMKFSLDENVAGTQITATGFTDAGKRRGKMLMHAGERDLVMVFDKYVTYMQAPKKVADRMPDGKTWIKLDLAAIAKAQGIDFGALSGLGADEQRRSLDQLRAATHTKKVGTEDVRGVPTTHYRATIDFDHVADAAPPARRAEAERSVAKVLKQMPEGDHVVPVEVWVDAQKRLRRFSERVPTTAGTVDVTEEFFAFGTSESIAIPPSSTVFDATEKAMQLSEAAKPS